jgi:hypothetical protein
MRKRASGLLTAGTQLFAGRGLKDVTVREFAATRANVAAVNFITSATSSAYIERSRS